MMVFTLVRKESFETILGRPVLTQLQYSVGEVNRHRRELFQGLMSLSKGRGTMEPVMVAAIYMGMPPEIIRGMVGAHQYDALYGTWHVTPSLDRHLIRFSGLFWHPLRKILAQPLRSAKMGTVDNLPLASAILEERPPVLFLQDAVVMPSWNLCTVVQQAPVRVGMAVAEQGTGSAEGTGNALFVSDQNDKGQGSSSLSRDAMDTGGPTSGAISTNGAAIGSVPTSSTPTGGSIETITNKDSLIQWGGRCWAHPSHHQEGGWQLSLSWTSSGE
jgi:hypothetical protein